MEISNSKILITPVFKQDTIPKLLHFLAQNDYKLSLTMKKKCSGFCIPMLLLLLMAGCGKNTASQENVNDIPKTDSSSYVVNEPVKDTAPNTGLNDTVSVNKEKFSMSDTIVLSFPAGPPRQFGIITPDEEFYFIASDTLIPTLPPLISSGQFVQLKNYELKVGTLMAFPYRADATKREKVFQKSGRYTLLLGNNLESDEEDKVEIPITIK